MTETLTTLSKTISHAGSGIPVSCADLLRNVIAALLAPTFLTAAGGDIHFAQMAAIETVSAYHGRSQADLVAVGQIVGYGLAALGSLSLSMADNISLSMTLRLRGNAVALNRSAEHNRRAIREARDHNATRHDAAMAADHESWDAIPEDHPLPEADALLSEAAAELLAAESQARLSEAEPTVDPVPRPPMAPAAKPAPTAKEPATTRLACRASRLRFLSDS